MQTSHSDSITNSIMALSRNPLTSLIILAPASKALRATSTFLVSIETFVTFESSEIIGITLAISSSIDMGVAPGRVDSPPTSIQSAPFSIISRALSTPPCLDDSWKESGVALMIPITRGRRLPPSS